MPPKAEPGQEGPAHIKPGTHAAHETKLKLAIPAQHASRVWQVLASHPREKLSTRKLFTVYYDTPDALLARHGVALGLRRQAGRWVQTVVTGGDAACGMHRREIYKTGVAAQLVSFSALVEAGLGDLIENKSVRDSFDVVFTADFSRTAALLLPGRDNSVYVSLDRGEIRAGSLRPTQASVCARRKAIEVSSDKRSPAAKVMCGMIYCVCLIRTALQSRQNSEPLPPAAIVAIFPKVGGGEIYLLFVGSNGRRVDRL